MRNWFFNLRTGTKLALAFTAALLVAILVGLVGLASVEGIYSRADRINRIRGGALDSLVKLGVTAETTNSLLFKGDSGDKDGPEVRDTSRALSATEQIFFVRQIQFLKEQANILRGNEEDIKDVAREEVGDEATLKTLADAVTTNLDNLQKAIERLSAAAAPPKEENPPATPEKPLTVAEAQNLLQEVLLYAKGTSDNLVPLAAGAVTHMKDARDKALQLMIGAAVVGALMAALVGTITSRMIVRPLNEMTAAAHRMSEGDLTAEISHVSQDEVGGLADSFRRMQGSLRDLSTEAQRVAGGDLTRSVRGGGELGESFNRMVESLSALLREIQESGTQVRGNSGKILANLQRNAEASREETAAADKVQASMEQLSESARAVAVSSADVERTAGDAARVASQGTASVGAALEGMFRVRERVNEITQKTLILGEKCRRIGEVLKIIRDVAGEIHMLALNAAIESAASAGEQGKRFTVVAAEVRRLAERTRQSAEEIRAILTEIQEAAEATVAAAQQGAKEVEAGSAVAGGARTAMEEVIGRIHKAAEAAREISRSTQDQRQSSEAVATSMRDISRAVRRMAEGSEESSKAVRELSEIAERFGDLVGTFRTG